MFENLRNGSVRHKWVCALILFCTCGLCLADRIVLKEGQVITGDILVEKQAQLYVDIGITVLTIRPAQEDYNREMRGGGLGIGGDDLQPGRLGFGLFH